LLLLVLILVLIAFGLLVVALLSGSVLWAWVSVGVSVAAAAVLLVDWLQRRSAVRAGADAGRAAPLPASAAVPPPPGRDPVVEPATEVLPVVPSDLSPGSPSRVDADTGLAGGRDERPDPHETVVLRAVTPSGSTERPSGAPDGTGSPEADSSQSVTNAGDAADRGERPDGPPAAGHAGETGDSATDADAEATVKVAAANRGEPAGVPAGPGGGAAHGGAPGGPPADLPPLGPDGAPPEEPHDADAAELVAELDDEVLVVDELPRYHQAGCRSLANTPVIPLPAREAVELGFTPCAWCTPNRALSSRHRAGAR
jgi:hypothetical protein